MAPYGPSPAADRAAALKWLVENGFNTSDQLLAAISQLETSDRFKFALNQIVMEHYGSSVVSADAALLSSAPPIFAVP